MIREKSIILSVIGLTLSSGVWAGHYQPAPVINMNGVSGININNLVTIPNNNPGFEFSVTGLALKPGASNLNYVIYNKELPAQSPTWFEQEIRPEYSGAFAIGLRYLLPTGKDINLDWTHLNSSTSTSVVAPDASYFLGPDYEIGPDGLRDRAATGKAEFWYDVVNLDVGQRVNFGRCVSMRFFGGLSNAYLREQVTSVYSGDVEDGEFIGPFSTQQVVTANFVGIGPRFGVEANSGNFYGFGLMGEAAVSALIGSTYAKTAFSSQSTELTALFGQAVNNQMIKDQNVMQVIPGLDAKAGITYKHVFCNGVLLGLNAGWQAAVYVNAINQYLPGTLVGDTELTALNSGGIFVGTMSHTLSNYSVQGPFFKATIGV